MATINKIMKTFNVPNGTDNVCYEIVDDKGRKAIAKDWSMNSTSAFGIGEFTIKDGIVYVFTSPHTANTAWNANQVRATNLGAEIAGKINKPPTNGSNGQVLYSNGDGTTTWGSAASPEQVSSAVDAWMDENITPTSSTVVIDDSLTQTAAAAQAKAAGDVVIVSSTEPEEAINKLWIQDQAEQEYSIPTMEDLNTKADKSDTVLDTTLSRGRKANTTVGTASLAFGNNVEASKNQAVAFGSNTVASGLQSLAEGMYTTASGDHSHAEGNYTTSSGINSHAEGSYTEANHAHQHVFGVYNVPDPSTNAANLRGNFVEIVGNGTSSSAKGNARTLDWNGNERLMGDLYVGANADGTGGTKLVTYATDVETEAIISGWEASV